VVGASGAVSSPAAAARRGGQGRRHEDGVGEEENTAAFYKRGLGCDGGVTTVIPPCYGASSGAADGPGVRRGHGARTAPRRRGSRLLGRRRVSGGGASDGAWPRAVRGARTPRASRCARDVAARAAPCPNDFAEHSFEKENLHFLNKIALTIEHGSCRSNYPLSFSKRLLGFCSTDFARNSCQL
jgi:hypothetical protein